MVKQLLYCLMSLICNYILNGNKNLLAYYWIYYMHISQKLNLNNINDTLSDIIIRYTA